MYRLFWLWFCSIIFFIIMFSLHFIYYYFLIIVIHVQFCSSFGWGLGMLPSYTFWCVIYLSISKMCILFLWFLLSMVWSCSYHHHLLSLFPVLIASQLQSSVLYLSIWSILFLRSYVLVFVLVPHADKTFSLPNYFSKEKMFFSREFQLKESMIVACYILFVRATTMQFSLASSYW